MVDMCYYAEVTYVFHSKNSFCKKSAKIRKYSGIVILSYLWVIEKGQINIIFYGYSVKQKDTRVLVSSVPQVG